MQIKKQTTTKGIDPRMSAEQVHANGETIMAATEAVVQTRSTASMGNDTVHSSTKAGGWIGPREQELGKGLGGREKKM